MGQNYNIQVTQYNEPFQDLESNCNEISFINKGQQVMLNGLKLENGDSLLVGGNAGEQCTAKFSCIPIDGTISIEVYVVRKIYI